MNLILVLCCSIILLCLAITARAANITAASCSSFDVQAAINSAAHSDVVIVPPGNCTWTTTVTIASKGITLRGAGIDLTNITDQGSGGSALIVTGASETNFVDISGFTWIRGTPHANGIVTLDGTMFSQAFRFHHNRFLMPSPTCDANPKAGCGRGIFITSIYGLFDHNTIDMTALHGSNQSISLRGSPASSDGGQTPWKQPLTLGSNNAVYVEDNTFNYTTSDTGVEDALDAYSGARFVVRYNQINNISMGHHGTDSGGMRSPVSFEVYNNTFTNNSSTVIRGWTVRGGTGVFFNNTYGGTVSAWYDVLLVYYRACSDLVLSWGRCDGTRWEVLSDVKSSDNSRKCSATGGFRYDATKEQLGPANGTYTNYFDGGGTGGYPCRDQPGRGPGQVLEPIFFWSNTGTGISPQPSSLAGTNNCNGFGVNNYFQAGRDYIDNGNIPKSGFTPYTYPHPLQAKQGDSTPPAAPINLTVTVQ